MSTLTAIRPLLAFQVERYDLLEALEKAAKLLVDKPANLILSNFKLEISGDKLTITASNGINQASFTVPISNGINGVFLIPGKLLTDVVSNLPTGIIKATVNAESNTLNLKGTGKGKYNLRGLVDTFPSMDVVQFTKSLTVSPSFFDVYKPVLYPIGQDETKGILCGCNIKITSERVTALGIHPSGHVMVRNLTDEGIPTDESLEFTLPLNLAKSLLDLVDVEDAVIELNNDSTVVRFTSATWQLTARLLEGRFPPVELVIDRLEQPVCSFSVDRKQLISALNCVTVTSSYTKDKKFRAVFLRVTPDNSGIEIYSNNKELGDASEVVDVVSLEGSLEGQGHQFKLNASYLVEALKVIKESEISISLNSKLQLIIESQKQIHVVVGISEQ